MNNSEILIYQNPDGTIKIDVRLEEEIVWLTQEQMAVLFGKGRSTVTEHISNVYEEGELEHKRTCRKFRQVRQEGSRNVEREIEKDIKLIGKPRQCKKWYVGNSDTPLDTVLMT